MKYCICSFRLFTLIGSNIYYLNKPLAILNKQQGPNSEIAVMIPVIDYLLYTSRINWFRLVFKSYIYVNHHLFAIPLWLQRYIYSVIIFFQRKIRSALKYYLMSAPLFLTDLINQSMWMVRAEDGSATL